MLLMVFLLIAFFGAAVIASGAHNIGELPPGVGPAPVAEKIPTAITVHGHTRVDDYFWLREKQNPKVMEYLKAEEAYTDAAMKPTEGLQDTLFKEMVGHIKETDQTAPHRRGNYFYYSRTEQAKQYPILCRKSDPGAPEQIVLDMNELADGHNFMSLGAFEPSDDGNLLAYTTDNVGYRQYTLHLKDLRTASLLPDRYELVDSVVWATDNRTFFYTTEDPVTKRCNKLFRQVLGSPSGDLIYEEADQLFDIGVDRTRDGKYILLHAASKTSTELRYLPAANPQASFALIQRREPDHEYDVEHGGEVFYIRTNKGARNFRVVTAPDNNPGEHNWKELVRHRPGVKVAGLDPFAGFVVFKEWEDGLEQIEVLDLATRQLQRIQFPEPVYSASIAQNFVFDTDTVRYHYQSLVTPSSVFDYNMRTQVSTLVKQTEVPGGFERANYVSERIFAPAEDGARIPISLVYRKNTPKNASAPMLLYAYGSYGHSIPPTFAPSRLALLDRGVIFAIAHVRGGGELGEPWRDAGRMMKKMNTFTDFIACAEYLQKEDYTARDRLVIQGASAGGMLMGGVANMRPDVFKAVIAQVPFLDVLNDMLDASLPLTTGEYMEWGNPNEKAAYEYMAQYSPYDNVKAQKYPAMLIKTSLYDSQVPYWDAAKFVARLRSTKTDANPLLLKVNFDAGHGGASGRYDALHEAAFNYAFVLWQAGAAAK
jgi:oligopeptidase B